jgi:helicase MOV-10
VIQFSPSRILFPVFSDARPVPNLEHVAAQLRPINRLIADNKPQRLAIASILHQKPGNIPFVIFGPFVKHLMKFYAKAD